jgi:hypothetical protein
MKLKNRNLIILITIFLVLILAFFIKTHYINKVPKSAKLVFLEKHKFYIIGEDNLIIN